MKKLEEAASQIENCNNPSAMPSLQPQKVIQSVKCIMNLMGNLCTLDLSQAVEELVQICKVFLSFREALTFSEAISSICNRIRMAVQTLIEMYVKTFKVDFQVKKTLVNLERKIQK